jgi:hypothetical protein
MSTKRVVCVALLSLGAVACGTEVNSQIEPGMVTQQGLEAQLPEAPSGPVLNASVQERIRATFERLRAEGVLTAPDIWQIQRQPPAGAQMARLALHNDADEHIADGYTYNALVPAGRRPSATPNQFYVERVGGIAGLRFIAGPFRID